MKRIIKTRRKPITEIGRLRISLSLVWLFVLLLLLFIGSCTHTDVEENVIPPYALKDVDAGFNLNVLATRTPVTRSIIFTSDGTIESDTLTIGIKDSVQTKSAISLTDDQESQIANLWVGQYDAVTGTRLFSQYLSSMTSTTVNLKLKQSQNKSTSRVYFVSNAGDLGAIADEATLKIHTLAYTSTEAGLPDNSLCKMMGMWEGEVVAGGVRDITVNLTRLLAKITFTYSMGDGFVFTPTSVQLRNAPTVSQVEVPAAQLTTASYTDYKGTASSAGATVYWYLPENMAGSVTGGNTVDSEKKKIGKGVTNATFIELNGNAVQGGVTYEDVTFRFYPGSDKNNYDILRNAHYTMAVTLVGIDVSDERITVGKIPDIEVDPTEMPAQKGGEKEIQITARPGQEWVFQMPLWLSALLDGYNIPSGATITHQGPATLIFKTINSNPKAEKREVSLAINVSGTEQNIIITQTGSTLKKGNDISLAAIANAEGSSSFTATEGLKWSAALSDGWLGWAENNPGISGDEAPADAQILKIKATGSNPLAVERSGKIVVKAGASVNDSNYTGLKQEIAVKQAGSTISGSTVNVNAEAAGAQSSFTATAGLDWALSVANGSWITLTGSSSGSPTTGNAQNVTFDVAVNPSSSQRRNDITVRAGDASSGPTNKITVTQKGAALSVSGANTVAATASATDYTSTFSATKGLSWNVSENMDWLTLTSTISGTNNTTGGNQDIKYSVVVNPNASTRNGNITVKAGNAVSGTDAGLTKTITVTQSASTLTASGSSPLGAAKESAGTLKFTGTKDLAITITPPSWITLTTTVPAKTTGSEQTVGYKANATNPDAAERAAANITVKAGNITKTVAVKQSASSLTASGTSPLGATKESSGTLRFTGTKDLSITITPPSWITLTTTVPAKTTGSEQTVGYKANATNPNAAERATANITVKAGNITKTVAVKQSASSLTASATSPLAPTMGATGTFTMNGTKDLTYSFTAGFPAWLTVTNGTASISGGTTTGGSQQLTYKTASVNPNSSERSATVTVRAGNIIKSVTIKQSASSFSITNPTSNIAAAAGSTTTGYITATAGLGWTISPNTHNGITVSPASGTGSQSLTFKGAANTGAKRTGTFTVSIANASPARTATITATQTAGEIVPSVGNIQVCKTEEAKSDWNTANTNCNNSTKEGKSDWRLPTVDELVTMYNNKSSLNAVSGFDAFINTGWYWSNENMYSDMYKMVYFGSGLIQYTNDYYSQRVRCVRNI